MRHFIQKLAKPPSLLPHRPPPPHPQHLLTPTLSNDYPGTLLQSNNFIPCEPVSLLHCNIVSWWSYSTWFPAIPNPTPVDPHNHVTSHKLMTWPVNTPWTIVLPSPTPSNINNPWLAVITEKKKVGEERGVREFWQWLEITLARGYTPCALQVICKRAQDC